MSKEDCKQAIGADCVEKVLEGLNKTGEVRYLSDGDLADILGKALKTK